MRNMGKKFTALNLITKLNEHMSSEIKETKLSRKTVCLQQVRSPLTFLFRVGAFVLVLACVSLFSFSGLQDMKQIGTNTVCGS